MGKEWPYRPDTEDEQKSLHGAWYSNFIYYFCYDQQKLAFIKPTATNDICKHGQLQVQID